MAARPGGKPVDSIDALVATLPGIQSRLDAVEPVSMQRFELRGVLNPLIRVDSQPLQDIRLPGIDVASFVLADGPASPVEQAEVIPVIEQDARLIGVADIPLEMEQWLELCLESPDITALELILDC